MPRLAPVIRMVLSAMFMGISCVWVCLARFAGSCVEPAARPTLIGPVLRSRLRVRWSCIRAVEPEEQCDQRASGQQELDRQVGAEGAAGCNDFQCKRSHDVFPAV